MRCPRCLHQDPTAPLGAACAGCDGVLVEPAAAAAYPTDRALGRVIDSFAIVERLGGGGQGVVYRALHGPRRHAVALKLIPAEADRRARFTREVAALTRLGSRAGPRLLRAGEARLDGRPTLYLATELVEGTPLSALLAEHGALPIETVRGVAEALLERLAAAHAVGVVHRDLKPAHVLLTARDGARRVEVLDFGIARICHPDRLDGDGALATLTTTGVVVGTPAYIAPEQIDARAPIGPATDLYAVGVIVHEMLTGARPFDGLDPTAVMRAHLNQAPPRLPGRLGRVVEHALQKDPAERFASASAMARALDPGPRRALAAALGLLTLGAAVTATVVALFG